MPINLTMPTPEPNGFVKTLNNMGYMTTTLDPYSRAFVEFARIAPGPSVDIGAAYGVATQAALQNGARVIANDIDQRHLDVLFSRVPIELRANLQLCLGSFPNGIDFEPETIGAVLISRVMHFFDGEMIERSANLLFQWLASGGKVFIVAETPYLKNFRTFIPIYEARRQKGEAWPGFVEDVIAIAPERGKSLPSTIHLLDVEVLSRTFRKAGFIVENAAMFERQDFPDDLQFDGRESVGLIARKP